MRVSELMSPIVISVSPSTTVRDAAGKMQRYGVGALAVLDGRKPVGIVTDRDIVTRVLSGTGAVAERPASAAMSPRLSFCFADQDVAAAAALMGDLQIRRLLVRDRSGDLVGVLSVGDIAENASEELAGQVLGEVSERR
ncbi:CBS domain-containing protein [Sediminimonas sp.]|uniref:CBS domain-containing protein n=1 Tax=Sediminimonas sp. TaxID=2823379 RepID=UPI0025DDBE00|nr:CBS domain-containing protein [Sediminimonas sp.]